MSRIREWLGNQLMAFAIRLLCLESETCPDRNIPPSDFNGYTPEIDEYDDDGQPMPAVELSEKAKAMIYHPPTQRMPKPVLKSLPLPGSYADRVRRARGV